MTAPAELSGIRQQGGGQTERELNANLSDWHETLAAACSDAHGRNDLPCFRHHAKTFFEGHMDITSNQMTAPAQMPSEPIVPSELLLLLPDKLMGAAIAKFVNGCIAHHREFRAHAEALQAEVERLRLNALPEDFWHYPAMLVTNEQHGNLRIPIFHHIIFDNHTEELCRHIEQAERDYHTLEEKFDSLTKDFVEAMTEKGEAERKLAEAVSAALIFRGRLLLENPHARTDDADLDLKEATK